MSFIDLFRPKWKHSDVEVRTEAVRHLEDIPLLIQVAQKDKDARVRRIAVKRLDDAAVLEDIAAHDPDEGIRELAGEKASSLLVGQAAAGQTAALARLKHDRDLAEVARRAAGEDVRRQAVGRIADEKVLADVVRRAESVETRLWALERIAAPALLRELAISEEHKAVALAAVARVEDREALEEIARSAKAKAARGAARDKLPAEAEAPRPVAAPRPADKTRRARLLQLAVAAEAAAGRSDWDAAARELEDLAARWTEIELDDEALEKRFADARKRFETRRQADAVARAAAAEKAAKKAAEAKARAATVRAAPPPPPEPPPAPEPPPPPVVEAPPPPKPEDRLLPLVLEIEKLVGVGKIGEARLADLERRVKEIDDGSEGLAELRGRFAAARDALAAKIAEEKAKREARAAETRAKIDRAVADVERAAAGDNLRAAEGALRGAQAALKLEGADEEPRARLRASIDKLSMRVAELRDAEGWRRWASVPKLEELCKEAEALAQVLAEVEDKRRAPVLLKELQERWKAVGPAPKEKHDVLWTRFKAACDVVYERYKEYFGKLDEERGGNLTKKEELCVQVEALVESTDWKETSEKIKALQEQWKAIGPVPVDKADAVWKRFRAACDAFFDRRKVNDKERDAERAANLEKKLDLCARVEALATSTDWKDTAALIKGYQEQWQAIGPVARGDSDAVWKRFRAACDAFFERRKAAFAQLDEDRQQNLKTKQLMCEKAEALASADDHDAALEAVKALQAEWKTVGPVPKDVSDELWRRFRTACDVIYAGPVADMAAAAPAASEGTGVSGFSVKLPLEGLVAKLAGGEAPAAKPKKEKGGKPKPA